MIVVEPLLDTIQLLDISDEEYFGNGYTDYISNSRLKLINPDEGGNPEIYKEGLRIHNKYSDSLYFGSAVHQMILQPEEFHIAEEVNRPTAKAGFMADELYTCFMKNGIVAMDDIIAASNKIGYYKDKLDDNKVDVLKAKYEDYFQQRKKYECKKLTSTPIYLDKASRFKLKECLDSVKKNKQIQSLLHPKDFFEAPIVMNEVTLLMDVKVTIDGNSVILKLKAKLDNFTFDKNDLTLNLNDLKTTGHYLTKFEESFYKYHYHRQMGDTRPSVKKFIEKTSLIAGKSINQ